MIEELRARKFPCAELHALDDERHVGRPLADEERAGDDRRSCGFSMSPPLIFRGWISPSFCGRAALSERYAEEAAAHGWVIDGSPTFRTREDVPLVAADVNAAALQGVGTRGLVALPGSASVALATALAPLHALAGPRARGRRDLPGRIGQGTRGHGRN